MAFEQGKILPTPETIPFRLTRDVVDGMGVTGVEGTFRRSEFLSRFYYCTNLFSASTKGVKKSVVYKGPRL